MLKKNIVERKVTVRDNALGLEREEGKQLIPYLFGRPTLTLVVEVVLVYFAGIYGRIFAATSAGAKSRPVCCSTTQQASQTTSRMSLTASNPSRGPSTSSGWPSLPVPMHGRRQHTPTQHAPDPRATYLIVSIPNRPFLLRAARCAMPNSERLGLAAINL